ncbi:hypothetical protein HMPREF9607_01732 [Cutibacterium modestum HL044PA1]|uniref:O-antigen ligase-related domain-containing protein n=1 Tax=Cutibacterium modestum HL044PA1 TaxID=765109 RepID=A0ABP2K7X9_9ACTN|nr:hypothetical protein HMPREF9607_01732 [Cutibacterium modestum HL044PA1]
MVGLAILYRGVGQLSHVTLIGLERYRRDIGPLTSWGLSILVVVEAFADFRHGLTSPPWIVSSYLIVDVLVILACGPALWLRRHELGPAGRWILGGALGLMMWAIASASMCPLPRLGMEPVTRSLLVMAPLTAVVTLLAGLSVAAGLTIGSSQRVVIERLWWPAVVMTCASYLQWPRAMKVHGSARLATGMGGSAVLHVALLLACGVLVAAALAGYQRVASGVLAVGALVAVILTGSRAGLACATLFVLGCAIGSVVWRRSWVARGAGHGRVVWGGLVALAVVVVGMVVLVPGLRRMLNPSDPMRSRTLRTGIEVWSSDLNHVFFGFGSGRLWPWYLYDSHARREPWRGLMMTEWGPTLTSAHSTVLAVLVELGLLGLVLLIPVLLVPVVELVRHLLDGICSSAEVVLRWAVVATLPAFLLDTYLIKNFGVSMWWWAVALSVVVWSDQRPPSTSRQNSG